MNGRTGLRRSTSKRLAAVLAGAVLHGPTLPGAAVAQDPDEAARQAAQEVGEAGQAAARAVATDAAQALEVPGFAGTDLSQADLSAGELEGAGQNALADPDDLGGGLGRALARGALSGPAVSVSEEEPGIRRAESVQSSPNAPEWRADGLVSGTVSECARELDGAQSGGTCGAVTYCVGAGCETIATPANSEFVSAATQLNLVMEMGARNSTAGTCASSPASGHFARSACWGRRTAARTRASSSRRGSWAARFTRSNWPRRDPRG